MRGAAGDSAVRQRLVSRPPRNVHLFLISTRRTCNKAARSKYEVCAFVLFAGTEAGSTENWSVRIRPFPLVLPGPVSLYPPIWISPTIS